MRTKHREADHQEKPWVKPVRVSESLLLTESLPHGIGVPFGFPDFKTVVKYNSPKVTADEVLNEHAHLKLDYPKPINELKLLEVTSSRFNIWGRL
jgi:Holliday junction resolvase YEN1